MHKSNRLFGFILLLVLAAWCLMLAGPSGAQEKKDLDAEAMLEVLTGGAASLGKGIAEVKAEANEEQKKVEQTEASLENLRARIAALRASQAAGKLQIDQAEEALESFSEREEQVASRLDEVRSQRKRLAEQLAARIDAFRGLEQEVQRLEATKHPTWDSPAVREAYGRYQQLASEYQAAATQVLELQDKVILALEQEHELLNETIKELQRYVELIRKEALLKRQDLVSLTKTIKQIFKSLIQLPGRLANYLTDPELPEKIKVTLKNYWAQLLGLLTTLLVLAWIARWARLLFLPRVRQLQFETEELDVKVISKAGEIIADHFIGLSFLAWLALTLWIMEWGAIGAAHVLLIGVAVWMGLRLGFELVQAVFEGKEKGGILPLENATARFYRRHLKLLLAYVLVLGFFGLNLFFLFGTKLEGYDLLELVIQVGFLAWVLWLLRKRYFEKLQTEVPGPAWGKVRIFLFIVRAFIWLVLGAILVSSLLGFQKIADDLARGASLSVIIVFLFWLIELTARGIFDYVFIPEKDRLPGKIQRQEELLRSYYLAVLRVAVTILTGGVFLLILRLWGIDFGLLRLFLKVLTWGIEVGPVSLNLLTLGLAALALYLGRWFSRFLRTFLEVRYYPQTDWDESLRYTVSNSCHYIIQAIAILVALGFLGVSFGDLAIVAAGLGVGIGFGLQNIVNNFISGLILLFERPIKVGDMLVIDGQWGAVKEIRVRSTIFQTYDRYVLIIPNSDLISNKVLNWTYYGPGINRLTLKIGVSYGSDVRQVTKLLDEVCRANPRVLQDPPPLIYFEAYGDSSLNFNIWVHVNSVSDRIPATHELNSAIFEAFNAHGIEIPFPQRDLYVKSWPEPPSPLPLAPESQDELHSSPQQSSGSRNQGPEG